jgi:predicted nucleotidyltransferase
VIEPIEQRREEIAAICRKYRVQRLDIFGSAARGDFQTAKSDIDFFYDFDLADTADIADRFFGLKEDLVRVLGVEVDLASAQHATNPYFLEVANRYRQTLYAA